MGVERCVRFAFDLAARSERHHLTLVHKTNVLTFAGDLWQRTFDEVARSFDDIGTAYNHVDAACIYLVQDPARYDVIVTDNLFGDILTDLGGAIAGGIGRAASANLNPARTGPSLFEPVHGSAPDIAGTGRADPRAAVVLHPADRVLRLRRDGSQHAAVHGRRVDRVLALGRVPRRRRGEQGRAHEDLVVDATRPQHDAAALQDHRELRELVAGQGR